jgi:ubiquinone/menaquinone biosynthesis C-methylase UbiE
MAEPALDRWATWILERRFGGDPGLAEVSMRQLALVRGRVLEGAAIREGDVVLDVGAGDGLIAFGALPLVGKSGKVIFGDISQDLLDLSRGLAEELGELDRCEFVLAAAEDLTPLADVSVDVVTTRSVLIYVKEKQRAFDAFFRVLKPGGRLSMFEPINRFASPGPEDEFLGFDVGAVLDLAVKVEAAYKLLSRNGDNTLIDFDERDLLGFSERAGFRDTKLVYEAGITHEAGAFLDASDMSWDAFLNMAPNPLAPTLAETIDQALTAKEAKRFLGHLQPLYEERKGTSRQAVAYLRAVK